jgi:2-keto-4-pentenoate hydratase/2-oxohepta-3-ene-1,7-dioic acid hydratase in catechol pathway
MRLVRFLISNSTPDASARVGALVGGKEDAWTHVVDLSATLPCGGDMRAFLAGGMQERAEVAVASGAHRLPRSSAALLAPIDNCEKLLCVGMNYREHCTEQNYPFPKVPLIFSKFASSLTAGGGAPVHFDSRLTQKMDWEVELAVVVGREVPRNTSEEDADAYIAGYTVAHDVSARDWQMEENGGQWLLGKTMDTFSPIGPAIVTKDEVPDIHSKGIRCYVNGKIVQDSNTSEMVHTAPQCVAWISKFVTLKPGDLIFTGTPSGVGCFRNPPVWLGHGDIVKCEIDGLGSISNECVDAARTHTERTLRSKI